MALGVYPEVTLAQARERHQDGRKQLAAEVDPMAQRKQQASAPAATTFEQATRQWWAHWSPSRSARHAEYVIRRLEADIFPEIGNMPIGASRLRLSGMQSRKSKRGARFDVAKRALQTCGQIMRYAVAHDLAERNPVAMCGPPTC